MTLGARPVPPLPAMPSPLPAPARPLGAPAPPAPVPAPVPAATTVPRVAATPAALPGAADPGASRLVVAPAPEVAEALGRFASKVAHELNNVLTAISSYGEMLLEDLPEGAPAREDAVEILAATRRAAALGQALHELGRPSPAPVEPVELSRWSAEVMPRLAAVLGGERAMLLDPLASPLVVAVDAERLARALEALVTNAREATAPGGHCTLRIERVSVRAGDPEYPRSLAAGRHARITVLDDGCGMDAALLARAAEPLFGTRRGARRGMGLAMVELFARTSGGALQLRSAAGSGTAAAVYLPVATARDAR